MIFNWGERKTANKHFPHLFSVNLFSALRSLSHAYWCKPNIINVAACSLAWRDPGIRMCHHLTRSHTNTVQKINDMVMEGEQIGL